jgi:hypothetical protein
MLERMKQMMFARSLSWNRSVTGGKTPNMDNDRIIEEARKEIARSQETNKEAERLLEYYAALADVRLWEKE